MRGKTRRNTRQRAVILKILRRSHNHPGAEEIYREARKIIPNISLGTVYRNLNILKEQGKISEVKSEFHPGSLYDGVVESHSHFQCEQCGRLEDVTAFDKEELIAGSNMKERGEVTSVQLVFLGKCKKCLESSPDSPSSH